MKKIIIITISILVSGSCYALEESAVQNFFDYYQTLSNKFDAKMIDLYSDDAKISTFRRYPNGPSRKMEMTGQQYKILMKAALPSAKSSGDKSKYTKIKINIQGQTAKISAHRYSLLKNYTDKKYYMVVKQNKDGGLIIVEEHTETQPQTNPWQESDGSLDALLKFQENRIKGHLPLLLDQDTRLDSVKIDGKKFIYLFTILTLSKDEPDHDVFKNSMRETLVNQSCSNPELKQILTHGGSLGYTYKDKNGETFVNITITIQDCEKK